MTWATVKGFIAAVLLLLVILGGKEFYEEYRYYQQVKFEHQGMMNYQFGEIGKLPNGQAFSRAAFFDALLKEASKAKPKE
jgi:hypothetical protein